MTLQLHTGRVPGALLSGSPQIVRIDQNGFGDYTSFGAALAAITDESATKQYVLVPSPGTYVENVVLRRWIHIISTEYGSMIDSTVVIDGVGPTTLTMPGFNCSVQGLKARVVSANPAHHALLVYDDGGGSGDQPACINCYISEARGGAGGTRIEAGGLICLVGGHDAYDGGVALHQEPGTMYLHIGGGGIGSSGDGMNPGSSRGLEAINAFALLSGNVNVSADPLTGTGIYFYADATAAPLFLENMTFADAFNGLELADDGSAPGPIAVLSNAMVRGSLGAGAPVTIGAGSTAIVFPGAMGGNLAALTPMQGWVVNGVLVRGDDATWGSGTVAPNERPAVPPIGFQFWATDYNLGAGGLITWNGAAWVDATGVVVP